MVYNEVMIINDLTAKRCVACEGGMPALTPEEVTAYLSHLQTPWETEDDSKKIKKIFIFKDFKESLAFVNKVGALAEEEGHHPDLHLFYGRVIVELSTHAVKGLSENDFILAAKIEKIAGTS